MVRCLTEQEYVTEAEPFLRKVFIGDNATEAPFAPEVEGRKLLYRYKYDLGLPLAKALASAATKIGDKECYLTVLWRPGGFDSVGNWSYSKDAAGFWHWKLSLSEMVAIEDDYNPEVQSWIEESDIGDSSGLETVIYSVHGKWGIMLNHEGFVLLGGSAEFVAHVVEALPDIDNQVFAFLEEMRYIKENYIQATLEWIPNLLTELYGEENAVEMLKKYSLP
jgi:hypothetical protein